ncbi:hypothetical protein ACP4OV_005246 [Aristida adscensionis]
MASTPSTTASTPRAAGSALASPLSLPAGGHAPPLAHRPARGDRGIARGGDTASSSAYLPRSDLEGKEGAGIGGRDLTTLRAAATAPRPLSSSLLPSTGCAAKATVAAAAAEGSSPSGALSLQLEHISPPHLLPLRPLRCRAHAVRGTAGGGGVREPLPRACPAAAVLASSAPTAVVAAATSVLYGCGRAHGERLLHPQSGFLLACSIPDYIMPEMRQPATIWIII